MVYGIIPKRQVPREDIGMPAAARRSVGAAPVIVKAHLARPSTGKMIADLDKKSVAPVADVRIRRQIQRVMVTPRVLQMATGLTFSGSWGTSACSYDELASRAINSHDQVDSFETKGPNQFQIRHPAGEIGLVTLNRTAEYVEATQLIYTPDGVFITERRSRVYRRAHTPQVGGLKLTTKELYGTRIRESFDQLAESFDRRHRRPSTLDEAPDLSDTRSSNWRDHLPKPAAHVSLSRAYGWQQKQTSLLDSKKSTIKKKRTPSRRSKIFAGLEIPVSTSSRRRTKSMPKPVRTPKH